MIKTSNAFGMLALAAKNRKLGTRFAKQQAREALTYAKYWRLHPSTKVVLAAPFGSGRDVTQAAWKASHREFRIWRNELTGAN